MQDFLSNLLNRLKCFRSRVVELDFSELYYVYAHEHVHHSHFKGGVMVDSQFISVQSLATKTSFRNKVLRENIYTSHFGLAFPVNHFLYDIISKKIRQLKTGGIINYWTSPWLKSRYEKKKEEIYGPEVLNMEDLGTGFEIWIYMLLFSFCIFLIEAIKRKRWLRKLSIYVLK